MPAMPASRLVNRSILGLIGQRTSMRLEPELWEALDEMAARQGVDRAEMVRLIEQRGQGGGRTSSVRVAIVAYFREAATDEGHERAGHGSAQKAEAA